VLGLIAEEQFIPNQEFGEPASDEQIGRTVRALQANNIEALVAENAEEARRMFFEQIPEGPRFIWAHL
jgi:hypothetical protein